MSDGVLTPAQSILGAVQCVDVIVPSIGHGAVVGTTCGILVLLFAVQPFGTTKYVKPHVLDLQDMHATLNVREGSD